MRAVAAAVGLALLAAACRPPRPQEPAPDVGIEKLLQAPSDSLRSLSELKGNVVVLEFWATWCGPCVEKLPHMNKMVAAFEGQPVKFISVTEESEDIVREFTKTHPMKAWIGLDPYRKAFSAFKVKGIPDLFVIDPFGRITLRVNPSWFYKSDIEKALKAKPPAN